MADTDLLALAREVDTRCRLRGRFVLRSGQVTGEYFDKYLFESDPVLLHRVAEQMLGLIPAAPKCLEGSNSAASLWPPCSAR
jgi:orotate phosphoribosyltransferase